MLMLKGKIYKKKKKNQGKGKREHVEIHIHTHTHTQNGTPCTTSNEFIIFCVSVQLFVQKILGIHVSLTYWIKRYEFWHG